MLKRFQKGQFNMNDLRMQLDQMLKMGGMQGVMGMLPGMGKAAKAAEAAGLDDRMLRRQIALIQSMTKKERANPDLLQASRKRRIAAGAGLDVAELNRLLKMHRQMADMMKKMGKGGMLKAAVQQMFGKGGAPDAADPAALQAAAKSLGAKLPGGGLPGGMPGAAGGAGGLPGGLSGLGRSLGLPAGLSGFGSGKKK
jgi:signal recognition particle subunit SRP54